MEFCPKCGAMLMSKKCECGYEADADVKLETSESIEGAGEVVVVNDGDGEVNPIVDKECVKCGHPECYFWTKQTRAGDEAETKFYKCVKCKHTWRDYR